MMIWKLFQNDLVVLSVTPKDWDWTCSWDLARLEFRFLEFACQKLKLIRKTSCKHYLSFKNVFPYRIHRGLGGGGYQVRTLLHLGTKIQILSNFLSVLGKEKIFLKVFIIYCNFKLFHCGLVYIYPSLSEFITSVRWYWLGHEWETKCFKTNTSENSGPLNF